MENISKCFASLFDFQLQEEIMMVLATVFKALTGRKQVTFTGTHQEMAYLCTYQQEALLNSH